MLGAFLMLYAVLALYGSALLYRDVEDTGCDPSGGVNDNATCPNSGSDVFGAMLGVAFAGQGVSQVGNFFEAFAAARIAAFEAYSAIRRTAGAPAETIYKEDDAEDLNSTVHSRKSKKSEPDVESAERPIKAILPKYEIDSTSDKGKKPSDIAGTLAFNDVRFNYPTRPTEAILKGLSVEIEAGKISAFCGPSGGGKSTVMSLIERFYDPLSGSVSLDGVNLRDINVSHLRSMIGYVGQEPTLFATSIRGNIRFGNPDATDEMIESAARMANAHDFIMSFSDGYDTQVGDRGSQLSGGQKQRIAIGKFSCFHSAK
jgi:ATP-binding cassette subfamily B (MDR/TAP) protein 1